MPTEEAELVTEEFKRVKRKVGRFKLKKKKISAEDIKSSVPKIPKALLSPPEEESEEDSIPDKKSTIESDLEPIDNKLDELIDVIRKDFNAERKQQKLESNKDQNKLRDQKESKREGKKQSNILGSAAKKAIKPFTGILDRLKKFAMFTFAGFLADKVLKFFTDPKNIKKREAILNFLEEHGPKIFAGALLFLTPLGGLFIGLTATILKIIGGVGGGILLKAIALLATPIGLKALALALAATGGFATIEAIKDISAGGSGLRAAIEEENKIIDDMGIQREGGFLDQDAMKEAGITPIPGTNNVRQMLIKTGEHKGMYRLEKPGGEVGAREMPVTVFTRNADNTGFVATEAQRKAFDLYKKAIKKLTKEKEDMEKEVKAVKDNPLLSPEEKLAQEITIRAKYNQPYIDEFGNPSFFQNLFGRNQPEQPVRREDESEESFLERQQRRVDELLNATFGSGRGEPESVETSPPVPPVLREGFSTIEEEMIRRGMSPTSSVPPPAPTTVSFVKLPDKFETASAANQPVKSGNEIPDFKIVNLHNRRVQVTNALGIGELV
jgi:hypothetical protein